MALVALGAVAGWAGVAVGTPPRGEFGAAAFDEVVAQVRAHHIRPLDTTPRPWVAAANAALSSLRPAEELLEQRFRDRDAGCMPGTDGELVPLRCGGPPSQAFGRHRKPARRWKPPWRREVPPWGYDYLATREVEVESIGAWESPFGEAEFRCVMSLVLAQTPVAKRSGVYRRAAQWWLRAHDAHSRLADDEAWAAINDKEARLADVGMTLRLVALRWQVLTVSKGGPAALAGVWVDDWLVAVDRNKTDGLARAEIAALLTRKVGARVALQLQTGARPPRRTVLTVREVRELDVTSAPLPGVKGGWLIKVQKFAPGGEDRLAAALNVAAGAERWPRAILLDLRGNGGGVFPVALAMLAQLTGGAFATVVTTRDGSAEMPIKAREGGALLPQTSSIVVLIDIGCGSACELVAAALRHHRGALVVGSRSYGKATLQDGLPLTTAAGRVLVTIGHFSTPGGAPIHGRGVTPDVSLSAARRFGQRQEDQAFVLRLPDAGAPSASVAIAPLQRCVATLPPPTGRRRQPLQADATPAQLAVDEPVVQDAIGWLRCVASGPALARRR